MHVCTQVRLDPEQLRSRPRTHAHDARSHALVPPTHARHGPHGTARTLAHMPTPMPMHVCTQVRLDPEQLRARPTPRINGLLFGHFETKFAVMCICILCVCRRWSSSDVYMYTVCMQAMVER